MCYLFFFFFNDTATTEIYTYGHTLSLHDALPSWRAATARRGRAYPGTAAPGCRARSARQAEGGSVPPRSAAWRSEEHTSELQSLMRISYAVFCLKQKKTNKLFIKYHTS